jgi:predicted lipase
MTDVRAIQPDVANDAFAFVGKLNNECLAVFRGTSNLNGWIQDLKSAVLVNLEDQGVRCTYGGESCQVGDGFMKNYQSVEPYLKGNLTDIGCTKGSRLSITGHSLGAAEAAIAMFDLKNDGYDIVESYTFGQPRVGDSTFTAAFEAEFGSIETWRVTHADDPVVHLPFEFMGFSHIATEVYYADTVADGFKICDGSGEDQSCSNSRSAETPAAILTCAADQAACPHLTYMTATKQIDMSGSSCAVSSISV